MSYLKFPTKHKVFISFYHHDDQYYKDYLEKHFGYGMISKSVQDGEYDPDDSAEYVKRLIREQKITDSSVIVVLIGPHTKGRKHVDWEIYAGLCKSMNGSSALLGIALPELRKGDDGRYHCEDLPERFADNWQSGYAKLYSWEYAKTHFLTMVDNAFQNRDTSLIDNSKKQMQRNRPV